MKPRNATISLLLILSVLGVAVLKWRQEPKPQEAFDRTPARLHYTSGALCRMDCRRISREEIAEVMKKGIIHFNQSNRRAEPCPTFALQGRTRSNEYIRVVFAQCPGETRVVTCYNLEVNVDCFCTEE